MYPSDLIRIPSLDDYKFTWSFQDVFALEIRYYVF